VGQFLDGFASSDAKFFERHLADDVELIFPGSERRWDKASTIASVADHPPYIEWEIFDSNVRVLGPGLTMVTMLVAVRTTERDAARRVVQSMLFDDTADPWTLRFLHQSLAS
jgi:ketosteroid isomerase-like protein